MENIVTKKCSKCKTIKQLSDFGKNKNAKDGLNVWCRTCANELSSRYRANNHTSVLAALKVWRTENKEHRKEYQAQWIEKNKEHVIEYTKQYYDKNSDILRKKRKNFYWKNPEVEREKVKQWAKKNHDKVLTNTRNRQARKRHASGKITIKEWKDLCNKYNNKCLCCGRTDMKLTLDHVMPLKKGGTNTIDNAQPLCLSCNISKGIKDTDYR